MALEWAKTSQSHDQYEQYDRLPSLLKRFSFFEKMRIASIYSSNAIMFKQNLKNDKPMVLPWCIETFVMLSMEADEYGDGDFRGKNEQKAIKMFNAIWAASSHIIDRQWGNFSFIDIFLPVTGLTQFQRQEIEEIHKYRYLRIFNDNTTPVFLKDVFRQKMGTDYEDFLLLGEVLEILFYAQSLSNRFSIPRKMLRYLLEERFPEAAKMLSITRTRYVELQQQYVNNNPDPYKYVYSLRPSFQYPLIEDGDNIYFPLPHLLLQSVTTSLLYRITEGDNKLREAMGKHIWEQYLYDTVRDSGVYDDVVREQPYRNSKSEKYGPDVLARKGKEVLFLDSKSSVPSTGIRTLDPIAFERHIAYIGDYINKLARHMWSFQDYSPYGDDASNSIEDYWGVVVVLEDTYMPRKHYYNKAQELLGLSEGSEKWQWVVDHIKVASLYQIEKLSLSGESVIDACKECFVYDPYSIPFSNFRSGTFKTSNISFLHRMAEYDKRKQQVVDDTIKAAGFDHKA